jgi:hypothetical protein
MAWTGSTHCTTTSERRRLSLDALPKGWLMLLSVMMLALFLSLPSLACAGDSYSDELRLLDLELEMPSLKSQMLSQQRSAIEAESREATGEREQLYKDRRARYRPGLQRTLQGGIPRTRIGPSYRARP